MGGLRRVDQRCSMVIRGDMSGEGEQATVQRPWGAYTTMAQGSGYKIKQITVHSGQSLSLQWHHHRSEHWIVMRGQALVRIGEHEYETGPGDYRFIPRQATHRVS